MDIILRTEQNGSIAIHPGEEYVDFLFDPLFNAGYSITNRLQKYGGSDESGYEGYLQIKLVGDQSIFTLADEIRKSLKVNSTLVETSDGLKIIFTTPLNR